MAKVPLVGTVKTRLQSVLPPEKCAELAAAFLADTLKKAETVCKNIILAYSPAGRSGLLADLVSRETILIEQIGAGLGEKMSNAFEFALTAQYSPVVMIGADSPTFPASFLDRAFEALENDAEIVLGKSPDGGFYLIGLRQPSPGIFERVAWSTEAVFEQITSNLKNAGVEKLKLLPEFYDVDTPEDLARMKNEILVDENLQRVAAETHAWLLANQEII